MADEMNGAESLVRTLARRRRERLLHQSWHFGDALCRRAGQGARHALRARAVRRRGDRRGRRLLPHARTSRPPPCCIWVRASPMGWPICTTPRRRTPASSTSSASMPPITSPTTPRSPPTSKAWRAPCRIGSRPRPTSRTVAADGALAIEAARQTPGQIATLILPADTAWGAAEGIAETAPPHGAAKGFGRCRQGGGRHAARAAKERPC